MAATKRIAASNEHLLAFLDESRGKVTQPVADQSTPGLTFMRASPATWVTKQKQSADYALYRGVSQFLESAGADVSNVRPVNPYRMLERLARERAASIFR